MSSSLKAPGILPCHLVNQPMMTGLKCHGVNWSWSAMSLLLVTVSGKDDEKKCYYVYIAVGQKCSTVAQHIKTLEKFWIVVGLHSFNCFVLCLSQIHYVSFPTCELNKRLE